MATDIATERRTEMETRAARTTGWVVVETLRNYGIDTVFGIPGTHNLEFYRPLTALGVRPVTTRHEQGAGYAADGWSLQTGKPGVVITTSGPGLLNALSAAGTAYCESRPMILLAVTFRLLDTIKLFDTIFIMTGGGPGTKTYTASFYLYTVGFTQFHLSQATAGSWIFLILTAAIVGLLVRRLLKAEPA